MRLAALACCLVGFVSACGPSQEGSSSLADRHGAGGQTSAAFPTGPNETVTPGKVCDHPDTYRYPEHIAYCERSVSSGVKNGVIHDYDVKFDYTIESMNRADFKIDHYISLCMGGSNDASNLWPQHKSVYAVTDPLEGKLCQLMSLGKLTQAEAIQMIKTAKNHLEQAPGIDHDLDARLARH